MGHTIMYFRIEIVTLLCVSYVLSDYSPFKLVQYKEDTDTLRVFRLLDLDFQNCSYYKEQGKSDQILFFKDNEWVLGKINNYRGISSRTQCPELEVKLWTPANITELIPCVTYEDVSMEHDNLKQEILTLTEEDCWNYVHEIATPIIGNGHVFMSATKIDNNQVLCKFLLRRDAMNSTFTKKQVSSSLRLHHKSCPKTWTVKGSNAAEEDNNIMWIVSIGISILNMMFIPVFTVFCLKRKQQFICTNQKDEQMRSSNISADYV